MYVWAARTHIILRSHVGCINLRMTRQNSLGTKVMGVRPRAAWVGTRSSLLKGFYSYLELFDWYVTCLCCDWCLTLCKQYRLQSWKEKWTCLQFWFSLNTIMNHALFHHQIWTRDSLCTAILNYVALFPGPGKLSIACIFHCARGELGNKVILSCIKKTILIKCLQYLIFTWCVHNWLSQEY